MSHKRLLWQLFPTYIVVTLAVLAAVGWFALRAIEEWHLDDVRNYLEAVSRLTADEIGEKLEAGDAERLKPICDRFAKLTHTRITIILPDGTVICDTEQDPARMENHADRPEIKEAFREKIGTSTRYSDTVKQRMQNLAFPLLQGERVIGVARVGMPVTHVEEGIRDLRWKIVGTGLLVGLAAVLFSWFLARRVSRPLEQLGDGARRFAQGQLDYRLAVPDTEEMAEMAESMNAMAAQLQERIRTIVHQRNEQEAILSSMVEGVVAVDIHERIISLNHAAAELIGGQEIDVTGEMLQEAIRHPDLRRFVVKALAGQNPIEDEIVLRGNTDQILRIRGAALKDAGGKLMGAVVVLNDMTQFRRLEMIRRDFVANVSHELRTPIASIKGFIETLLDGAMHQPDNAERFLKIIAKQADRLNAIIEDLLSLSKIEQNEEAENLPLMPGRIQDVLEDALHDCQPQAFERDVPIRLSCPDDLTAPINARLLQQAVANLLDNAIKYSEPGRAVIIEAMTTGKEVTISVRDHGPGIEKEHLDRIFERFYRVDRARSRKLGGTGLGLAIVKHIVSAHRGKVDVESTPGEGSNFVIHLPTVEGATLAASTANY